MKPIFYYDDVNSQVRACLALIEMINVDMEMRPVDTINGENFDDIYLDINPGNTVPSLVHNDIKLTDGHAILMYIATTWGGKYLQQLFPENLGERYAIINKLFFDSSVLVRRLNDLKADVYKHTIRGVDYEHHKRKIIANYNILESFLRGTTYMTGNRLTIADISIGSTLSGLDILIPLGEQKTALPKLFNWFCRMCAMPAFRNTRFGLERERMTLETIGKVNFSNGTKYAMTVSDSELMKEMKDNGLIKVEDEVKSDNAKNRHLQFADNIGKEG